MLTSVSAIAAKAALRRKKQHEHSLDQTLNQIGTLEQQINAIESANINRETLAAMEKAGEAMKQIHGKLSPESVDETMYATPCLLCACAAQETADTNDTGPKFRSKLLSAKRSSRLWVV